tara:strand:- start:1571 stop:2050 length:480 start_codon:yes stop_codon:yes gene_type:complete
MSIPVVSNQQYCSVPTYRTLLAKHSQELYNVFDSTGVSEFVAIGATDCKEMVINLGVPMMIEVNDQGPLHLAVLSLALLRIQADKTYRKNLPINGIKMCGEIHTKVKNKNGAELNACVDVSVKFLGNRNKNEKIFSVVIGMSVTWPDDESSSDSDDPSE